MPERIIQLKESIDLENEKVKILRSCYSELAHFLGLSIFLIINQ